jgi:hypothetical protein
VPLERILVGRHLIAGQRQLGALDRSSPRAPNLDPSSAERDWADRIPGPRRLSLRILLVSGAAQSSSVLLHHNPEHLLARLDAKPEEGVFDIL